MLTFIGWSVCLSLEKMSKIAKNSKFGLRMKTKVVDLLEYTKKLFLGLVFVRKW